MARLNPAVIFLTLLLGACGTGTSSPHSSETPSQATRSAQLTPTPHDIVALCHKTAGELGCPTDLPLVSEPYRARIIDLSHGPAGESKYQVLEISSYGPAPRFVHIVIKAGDLGNGFHFPFPAAGVQVTASPNAPRHARGPVLLGTRTWGGRIGTLVLAPSFPAGGIDGDHIVFKWSEDGTDYAVSMHASRPMAKTEGILRALVDSIEGPTPPS